MQPKKPRGKQKRKIDPANETYLEIEKQINRTVLKTTKHCPVDPHAAQSAAHVGFLKAYKTYDGRTKFTTWVSYKISKEIKTAWIKQCKRKTKNVDYEVLTTTIYSRESPVFDPEEFFAEFSRDARRVAELILSPPPAINKTVKKLGQGDSIPNFRYAIRVFLSGLGWSASRITKAFVEIKEKL